MHSKNDSELWDLIKQDNRLAFNMLYQRYWSVSYQLAYHILNDSSAAEDVVQEIFVELWEGRKQKQINHFKAYLMQATKFQVFKVIRHNKVIAAHVEQEMVKSLSYYHTDENLALLEIIRVVDDTVEKLPVKCRKIFNLSRKEQLSTKEIAFLLGISPKTVDNQIYIALKHVKIALKYLLVSFLFYSF